MEATYNARIAVGKLSVEALLLHLTDHIPWTTRDDVDLGELADDTCSGSSRMADLTDLKHAIERGDHDEAASLLSEIAVNLRERETILLPCSRRAATDDFRNSIATDTIL